jgi:formamidopyrimidine-DNA glycosylase
MPEGDTVFRAARTLNRALAGQIITKFETVFPKLARVDFDEGICGRTVDRVEAQGKWTLMYFSHFTHSHADEWKLAYLSARGKMAPTEKRNARDDCE